jgi:hypothetical protein
VKKSGCPWDRQGEDVVRKHKLLVAQLKTYSELKLAPANAFP